jgi:cellulose synthase (UDP-forming)
MRRRVRYRVPVMTIGERWVFTMLLAAWAGALYFFWSWWLSSGHVVTLFGMIANSLMFFWVMLVPGTFYVHLARMARTNPVLPPPRLRVAMIVTKAPSEPWEVVRRTLRAMLRQEMPYAYDVWLADEDPAAETLRWCHANGVRVSTRRGRTDYHRAQWPRRTRSKEGNLAFFYDSCGYRDYDVVSQLDSDHRPAPDYLVNIVRPFCDPAVGYVAAPSIDDANARSCWAVRGRFYKEAVFHGPQQAGAHGRLPPVCIGSHYAIRTKALQQIGGIGPELAEDFSTTLMMNAFGWHGAFALDAEAHGDGPETLADLVTQEFQWARSVTDVTLHYARGYWRGLGPIAKLKLGAQQLWYPLHGLFMLAATLFPLIALWSGTPWANVHLIAFFAHVLVVTGVVFLIAEWVGRRGWLRPYDAPTISWESGLYLFARWPWIVYGVAQSIAGRVLHRRFGFKVTPKGVEDAVAIRLNIVMPYLVISAVSAGTAILQDHPGSAGGYYYFCVLNAVLYCLVATLIVVLHLRENQALSWAGAWHLARAPVIAATSVAVVVAGAVFLRGAEAARTLVGPSLWGSGRRLVHEISIHTPQEHTHAAATWVVFGVGGLLLLATIIAATVLRLRGPGGSVDSAPARLGSMVFSLLSLASVAFVVLAVAWEHGLRIGSAPFAGLGAAATAAALILLLRGRDGARPPAARPLARPSQAATRDAMAALEAQIEELLPPVPLPPRRRRRPASVLNPELPGSGQRRFAPSSATTAGATVVPSGESPILAEISWAPSDESEPFGLTILDEPAGPGRRGSRISPVRAGQRGETPQRNRETSRAHALLYDRLILQGWQPEGRGGSWYAHRFRHADADADADVD